MIPTVHATFRRERAPLDASPCPAMVSVDTFHVRCGCGYSDEMDEGSGIRHDCIYCGASWNTAMARAKDKGEGTEPWLADYADRCDHQGLEP